MDKADMGLGGGGVRNQNTKRKSNNRLRQPEVCENTEFKSCYKTTMHSSSQFTNAAHWRPFVSVSQEANTGLIPGQGVYVSFHMQRQLECDRLHMYFRVDATQCGDNRTGLRVHLRLPSSVFHDTH